MIKEKKKKLGQYFTKKDIWLKPQIKKIIINSKCKIAYDPFGGDGDLLNIAKDMNLRIVGLDIDKKLKWKYNDSLISIPHIDNAIIITNPPYLAKQSATRKKINLKKYFNNSTYDDIYLIALEKMIFSQKYVVALIPESFINSNFKYKNLLSSITILEENPFIDTENPICIACFDNVNKNESEIKIYKNNVYIKTLADINHVRIEPDNSVKMNFNDKDGWLGLRAVDKTDDKTFIQFDFKKNINYDWENKIKVSSRHITLISIDIPIDKRAFFIKNLNIKINKLRKDSLDVIFTPFMGNTKSGKRRRRLDYKLARAILEKTYEEMNL